MVLESGPWHVLNHPVVVRRWEPGVTKLDVDLTKFPVWVNLKGVPLELYTKRGLTFIASGIGTPLYMDKATTFKQRLYSAEVFIEIDFSVDNPEYLEVELKNGFVVKIGVDIPWKPPKCPKCNVFGHFDCIKKHVEKVWISKEPKIVQPIDEISSVQSVQPVLSDIKPTLD
ncbi:hypothetical protein COLO4_19801 [Corchorus olitorius]|uniref:Uncharacterized protein n=1 Tax=Corchorus olitorius TaxID=93759 RepID=A0A1R3J3B8_9ROSI|nr:hypothetical protein COLO4_19801 [Corchorus olitorius]